MGSGREPRCQPAIARAIARMAMEADVRPLLSLIQVPTLILHRRDTQYVGVGHGRYLAEHIPNAEYVELEGADAPYWLGDAELMLDEIDEFLAGLRHGPEPDRALASVFVHRHRRFHRAHRRSW